MAEQESSGPCWLPLESNPDVINKFVAKLGLKPTWQFTDVFGLEADLLAMVPQPVAALLLLFPINEKNEAYRAEEETRIKKDGQHVSKDVFFMTQTIGNACGTIGLLHAIANNTDQLDIESGYLKTFIEKTRDMTAEQRGAHLENDEGITTAHEDSAQEGQTQVPSPDMPVNLHFVAVVHRDGHLYELDGRKPFPVNHGPTCAADFLQDAAKLCQQFMARDPTELHFTILALAKV